jgi:hypothetical protein
MRGTRDKANGDTLRRDNSIMGDILIVTAQVLYALVYLTSKLVSNTYFVLLFLLFEFCRIVAFELSHLSVN